MPPFSNSRFHTQPSTVVSTKKMHWLLPFVKSTRKLQSRLRCKKRPWWCGWKRAGKSTLPRAVSTQLKPRMHTNAHEFWVSRPVGLGGPLATARQVLPNRGIFGVTRTVTCQLTPANNTRCFLAMRPYRSTILDSKTTRIANFQWLPPKERKPVSGWRFGLPLMQQRVPSFFGDTRWRGFGFHQGLWPS